MIIMARLLGTTTAPIGLDPVLFSCRGITHANTALGFIMRRSGLMLCVLLAAACHQADALRVAPPVTTRRALLSLAAATSLASTPAFAEQDKQAEQAAPAVVARPLCR